MNLSLHLGVIGSAQNSPKQNHAAVAILKKEKDFCKAIDASRCTLLHFAVEYANAANAKYLIEFGAKVDAQGCHGNTSLMKLLKSTSRRDFLLVYRSEVDMVRILLEANANIHLRDENGTSVWQMLSFVDASIVQLLMQKLSEECLQDSKFIAETLIDANCPVPIAVFTRDVNVVTLMLNRGFPMVDPKTNTSVLDVAIDELNADIIKMIFERGVDVHARNASGYTPMSFFGLKFKNTEEHLTVLKLLLDYGAHKFDEGENMSIISILEKGDRQAISLLFRYDLDCRKKDAEGRTVLHYLACNSHSEVLEEMRDKDFDFKHSDKEGLNALHFSLGRPKIMEFLIEHGADVDSTGNGRSMTPLFAAYSNLDDRFHKCSIVAKLETIELLLKHGADPQVKHRGLSIFEKPPKNLEEQLKIEPILARLVKHEVLGAKIDKRIISKVQEHFYLKSRYDKFHKKIVHMKECSVYKSISLFTLMTLSQRQFACHMRNRDLAAKFLELAGRAAFVVDTYFCGELRRRLAEVVEVTRLRENVADVILEISGFHCDRHHIIVDRIIDNFSLEELRMFD